MKNHLPENHGLSPAIQATAELMPTENGEPSLTDIQFEALERGIATGRSALISAPTSTGKTLIGWWTIASAIQSGARAVYLVSHRALAKQKFVEVQTLFNNPNFGIDASSIICATGDGVEDASGRKVSAPLTATILIATYEKFLGCLSSGGAPRDLTNTCLVCDEIQILGDKRRGQNIELLLTLLRKARWKQFIGLSAVLSENDANHISDWLDLELIRNPIREKALQIECRSNTAVYDVALAPGRDGAPQIQQVVRQRATNRIVTELLANRDHYPVIVFCMRVDDTYNLSSEWIAGKPITNQVRVPAGLDINPDLIRALERRCAFHNSELSEDERNFVEAKLAENSVDVVYATSTLAAGVNFPLGSAVFASWRRWNSERRVYEPIGRAEFQNMAGRVGRMGQAAREAKVIIAVEDDAPIMSALALINFNEQEAIGIGITPDDFGSLTLQIFAGKLCATRADAFALLESSLSAERERSRNAQGVQHWEEHLNGHIDRLINAGCLIEARGRLTTSAFGYAVAQSGLKPETALYFINGLVESGAQLVAMLPQDDESDGEDDLLFVLAHAALSSPEFNYDGGRPTRYVSWRVSQPNLLPNDYARRLDAVLFHRPWMGDVSAANGALIITKRSTGSIRRDADMPAQGIRMGVAQSLCTDAAWILTGISEILAATTSPTLADESKPEALRGGGVEVEALRRLARPIRRVATRINAGLPGNVLWMTALELPGRRKRLSRLQILSLSDYNLVRPIDLMNGNEAADASRREALDAVDNPGIANNVRDAAKRWKVKDREFCLQLHRRRAERFHGVDIINNLYLRRGDEFEASFEDCLQFASINFENLDGRKKQAHPDYLVTIEKYPPLVVELKTRQTDTDLVPLNSAMEVLGASEVIGLRENFCVTLCSPGVEPSVPGIIERCGRLCVVDVSDFCEAILRLREGTLTRDEFYNWLTTPGIALIEDLPYGR
ncbi:DEAD/DEAH box helicase [Ferrovibrio terrae]|uniref:DEAD/DEAH box helicase n=1 Tax=Ferrovibrio terrae TaxID=2594003 RepID=A0A516H4Y8_9PROT|nr:DEAD/DEAH box helicase [Ferrovibrio terrae]QDO98854.1 DEAD/DEAH box helicase [Ferrovibrio terrae]